MRHGLAVTEMAVSELPGNSKLSSTQKACYAGALKTAKISQTSANSASDCAQNLAIMNTCAVTTDDGQLQGKDAQRWYDRAADQASFDATNAQAKCAVNTAIKATATAAPAGGQPFAAAPASSGGHPGLWFFFFLLLLVGGAFGFFKMNPDKLPAATPDAIKQLIDGKPKSVGPNAGSENMAAGGMSIYDDAD